MKKKAGSLYTFAMVSWRRHLSLCSSLSLMQCLYQYVKATVTWAGRRANIRTREFAGLMRKLAASYKKKKKLALAASTVEDKIADGKMPPGGLEQVERAVLDEYEVLIRVDIATLATVATKKEYYLRVLAVLTTAICVRISQGRMQVSRRCYRARSLPTLSY